MKCIDFSVKRTSENKDPRLLWFLKKIYVCGHRFSGGRDKHVRTTDTERTLEPKRIGCSARLTVKSYPGTMVIQALYTDAHSHAIGNTNARFTHLPSETRKRIEELLRLGMDPAKVVSAVLTVNLICT